MYLLVVVLCQNISFTKWQSFSTKFLRKIRMIRHYDGDSLVDICCLCLPSLHIPLLVVAHHSILDYSKPLVFVEAANQDAPLFLGQRILNT